MSTPRASEQISQQPEWWQNNMDSTLPSCFNAEALLPRLLFLVSPTCLERSLRGDTDHMDLPT